VSDDRYAIPKSGVEVNVPNPYGRISDVAAKLGVAPHISGKPTVIMTGDDGHQYDVWEVLVAFLDRMKKSAIAPEQDKSDG
jgi:hypothetical protein